MRRTLLPAAAVLIALTSCASDDGEELRNDLAAATAADGARIPDTGEGEGPTEEQDDRAVLEPAEVPTELVDAEGSVMGSAALRDGDIGVEVSVEVRGMTPGFHGMALHDVGTCDTADAAAGEAFPSVGELIAVLPPVLVFENGVGSLTTLVEPAPAVEELLVDDGTALVVYESVPDLAAELPPTGSRLACAPFNEA
ncbi:superoxide dismutase family protein [Geodermatophilus chilensis]|jgi:Cu/Zn superoxide dismutase|uniref:superoxide dismutase family protein n=1 Tax=Geodermatophilus chilensis TaxID=2035835 RepID=UPI000C26771E|nr:superoxide dismutase family protein [Geodermatophilus chilensis]